MKKAKYNIGDVVFNTDVTDYGMTIMLCLIAEVKYFFNTDTYYYGLVCLDSIDCESTFEESWSKVMENHVDEANLFPTFIEAAKHVFRCLMIGSNSDAVFESDCATPFTFNRTSGNAVPMQLDPAIAKKMEEVAEQARSINHTEGKEANHE